MMIKYFSADGVSKIKTLLDSKKKLQQNHMGKPFFITHSTLVFLQIKKRTAPLNG